MKFWTLSKKVIFVLWKDIIFSKYFSVEIIYLRYNNHIFYLLPPATNENP